MRRTVENTRNKRHVTFNLPNTPPLTGKQFIALIRQGASHKKIKVIGAVDFRDIPLNHIELEEIDFTEAEVIGLSVLQQAKIKKEIIINSAQVADLVCCSQVLDEKGELIKNNLTGFCVKGGELDENDFLTAYHFGVKSFSDITITESDPRFLPTLKNKLNDVVFSNCHFLPSKIKLPLHYPATDKSTFVTIDTKKCVEKYNQTYQTTKNAILDILSASDSEKEECDLFLAEYCFEQAIKEKKAVTTQDIRYLAQSKISRKNFQRVIVSDRFVFPENLSRQGDIKNKLLALEDFNFQFAYFKDGIAVPDFVLNLLENKRLAIQKLEKDKTHHALQVILKEAKKSAKKLEKMRITKIAMGGHTQLMAHDVIKLIRQGHRFFRGVIIQGDLDLSQLKNKNLSGIDFGNTIFGGKVIATGCQLVGANFQGAQFYHSVELDSADIQGARFQNTQFDDDLHANEKTKRQKSGWNHSHLNKITYQFGMDQQKNKVKITIHFENETQHLESIVAYGIEHDAKTLYQLFIQEYKNIRDKEFFLWRMRGDIVERLEKTTLTDAKKIHFLLRHAQQDPGSRTYHALQKIITLLKPVANTRNNLLLRSTSTLSDISTVSPIPNRFPDTQPASADHIDIVAPPETEIVQPDLLKKFFHIKENDIVLISEAVIKNHSELHQLLNAFQKNSENFLTIGFALKSAAKTAKDILDMALTRFFDSPYLFGNDDGSPEALERRKADEDNVVASYLFLKAMDANAVEKYDDLLRERIYPQFLKYVLYEKRVCNTSGKQTHYFRYGLIEALAKVAINALPNAESLSFLGKHRRDGNVMPQFFSLKSDLGLEFIRHCQKEWASMPLIVLHYAGCIDDDIFKKVNIAMQKHITEQNIEKRTRLEKQYYLGELIKAERFSEAAKEASAMRVAFGCDLFTENNVLEAVIFDAIHELKKKNIAEAKEEFQRYDSFSNVISPHFLKYEHRKESVKIIFENLGLMMDDAQNSTVSSCCTHYINYNNFIGPIYYGEINTHALDSIVKKTLNNRPFDPALLKKLDSAENYYPYVWIDEENQAKTVGQLNAAMGNETDNSRKKLLTELKNAVENAVPISELVKLNGKTPQKLPHHCFQKLSRALYRVEEVATQLDAALERIWTYDNFSAVIQKNPLQFRDPKQVETRKLIGHRFTEGPNKNFEKYKLAFGLYSKLKIEVAELEKMDDGNVFRKKCSDCFTEVEKSLAQITRHLGNEGKKRFGTLISEALSAVADERQRWMKLLDESLCLTSTLVERERLTTSSRRF